MTPFHILLVDDDSVIIQALRLYLDAAGYRVDTAESCHQAMAALGNDDEIDLMILDYMLPDGLGTHLLLKLVEEKYLQKPPVIMASSLLDFKDAAWETLRGRLPVAAQKLIRGYLQKPYIFSQMDFLIQEALKAEEKRAPSQIMSGDYRPPPAPSEKNTPSRKQTRTSKP